MKPAGVVIFPTPGAGHIVSAVELAKQLARHNPNLKIIILLISSPSSSPVISYPKVNLPPSLGLNNIDVVELPHILAGGDAPVGGPMQLIHRIDTHEPALIETIRSISLSTSINAFILDMFCINMVEPVSDRLGIPTYLFVTTGAAALACTLQLPILHKKYAMDLKDVDEKMDVVGLPSLHPTNFPSSFSTKSSPIYSWFVNSVRHYIKVKGHIVNTFSDLEPKPLKAITSGDYNPEEGPLKVYPVGPLLALDNQSTSDVAEHECIKWLDDQPDSSVVFLCFGSMGGFNQEQLGEIARGLELSGQRFLWRVSLQNQQPGSRAHEPSREELDKALPIGFVERTKNLGMVWTKWVPQLGILSHRAVGGFVSHCGWNSTLESLWYGVPTIAWPLYAEQPLNAFVLVEEMGLSIGLEKEGGGSVRGEELARSIKSLMEGEEGKKVRDRMKMMKELGRRAMDKGGDSQNNLASLVKEWSSNEDK